MPVSFNRSVVGVYSPGEKDRLTKSDIAEHHCQLDQQPFVRVVEPPALGLSHDDRQAEAEGQHHTQQREAHSPWLHPADAHDDQICTVRLLASWSQGVRSSLVSDGRSLLNSSEETPARSPKGWEGKNIVLSLRRAVTSDAASVGKMIDSTLLFTVQAAGELKRQGKLYDEHDLISRYPLVCTKQRASSALLVEGHIRDRFISQGCLQRAGEAERELAAQ